jgi:hypothetical protein
MRLLPFFTFVLCAALPAMAQPKPAKPNAANGTLPKEHISSPAPTQAAVSIPNADKPMPTQTPTPNPAPAPTATQPGKSSGALDSYLSALNDQLALSKQEQTDIKAYYQEDGAKLHAILNDASLSPIEQQRQLDDLRNKRNGKIGALLKDPDRHAKFLELENSHRVELVELAAQGALTPSSPPANVPQPSATPPADADKQAPGV